MRYQFIEEHRQEFKIKLMCRVLNVSSSGYYAWRKRPFSVQKMANNALLKEIKAAHQASNGVYGSPRIYRPTLLAGWPYPAIVLDLFSRRIVG